VWLWDSNKETPLSPTTPKYTLRTVIDEWTALASFSIRSQLAAGDQGLPKSEPRLGDQLLVRPFRELSL
jgi:hypothetical protein